MIGFTVVGKPAATVMTSLPVTSARSPRDRDVSADIANRFADDPELQRIAYLLPTYRDSFSSNFSAYGPAVNQKSKEASTSVATSVPSNVRPLTGTGDFPGTNGRAIFSAS
jgi:hypothetical protein